MRVLITTNSKHGLCLESVNNMLITTFVNNELITLPTLELICPHCSRPSMHGTVARLENSND